MAVWCKTSVSGRFCKHPVNDMGFPNEVLSGRYYVFKSILNASLQYLLLIYSANSLSVSAITENCGLDWGKYLRANWNSISSSKQYLKKKNSFLLCISYWIFKTFKMSLKFTAGWRWRHFSLRSGITTTTSRPCKQITKRRTKTFDPRLAIIGLNI